MKVYVICCNDSVEFAVIGNEERAKIKLRELDKAYYENNKWNFEDFAEYLVRCYWHIHEVDGEM